MVQVVAAAFRYAAEHDVPLAAFRGDTCATLKMHSELEVLLPPPRCEPRRPLLPFICSKHCQRLQSTAAGLC